MKKHRPSSCDWIMDIDGGPAVYGGVSILTTGGFVLNSTPARIFRAVNNTV